MLGEAALKRVNAVSYRQDYSLYEVLGWALRTYVESYLAAFKNDFAKRFNYRILTLWRNQIFLNLGLMYPLAYSDWSVYWEISRTSVRDLNAEDLLNKLLLQHDFKQIYPLFCLMSLSYWFIYLLAINFSALRNHFTWAFPLFVAQIFSILSQLLSILYADHIDLQRKNNRTLIGLSLLRNLLLSLFMFQESWSLSERSLFTLLSYFLLSLDILWFYLASYRPLRENSKYDFESFWDNLWNLRLNRRELNSIVRTFLIFNLNETISFFFSHYIYTYNVEVIKSSGKWLEISYAGNAFWFIFNLMDVSTSLLRRDTILLTSYVVKNRNMIPEGLRDLPLVKSNLLFFTNMVLNIPLYSFLYLKPKLTFGLINSYDFFFSEESLYDKKVVLANSSAAKIHFRKLILQVLAARSLEPCVDEILSVLTKAFFEYDLISTFLMDWLPILLTTGWTYYEQECLLAVINFVVYWALFSNLTYKQSVLLKSTYRFLQRLWFKFSLISHLAFLSYLWTYKDGI